MQLCDKDAIGTFDMRVTDLWAVGITVYLWCCGRFPFNGSTAMLIMEEIREMGKHVRPSTAS